MQRVKPPPSAESYPHDDRRHGPSPFKFPHYDPGLAPRFASALLYISSPSSGGQTVFPLAAPRSEQAQHSNGNGDQLRAASDKMIAHNVHHTRFSDDPALSAATLALEAAALNAKGGERRNLNENMLFFRVIFTLLFCNTSIPTIIFDFFSIGNEYFILINQQIF